MVSELLPLLRCHGVRLGNDGNDRHHLADAAHELQIPRLQLVWADEVNACIVHVLELQLFQENALCGAALVDVLLPDKSQNLCHIGIAVFICQIIAVPVCVCILGVTVHYTISDTGEACM